jgi:hypothetical protein
MALICLHELRFGTSTVDMPEKARYASNSISTKPAWHVLSIRVYQLHLQLRDLILLLGRHLHFLVPCLGLISRSLDPGH